MAPRIVRRAPLKERVLAAINPLDLLLNISTWISSYDWDNMQSNFGTPLGLTLNILCLFTRSHSDRSSYRRGVEDVIRRGAGSTSGMDGWGSAMAYSCYLISWALAIFSIVNTLYCAFKTRPYRLFESNIEIQPQTPSARRVRVDSSPTTSPIKLFTNLLQPFFDSPSSREHPSAARDVWEISIWDPSPLSLRLLALFSPAHVAVYFLSFPIVQHLSYSSTASSYVYQPTANVYSVLATVLVTQILISVQLLLLQKFFVQQEKDKALLSRQLMHEYDTKFVQPRLNIVKRDVAVQTANPRTGEVGEVDTYTPMLARQSFKTAANPNYAPLTTAGPTQLSPAKRDQDFGYSPLATMRQPQFGGAVAIRRPAAAGAYGSASFGGSSLAEPARRMPRVKREDTDEEEQENSGRPMRYWQRQAAAAGTTGPDAHIMSSNLGMHGLVNMSLQNSRSLSPSKMTSPFKRARGGGSISGLPPRR